MPSSVSTARVLYGTLFFVLASVLLVLARPPMLFDARTGQPKPFGTGGDCTLFSLGVAIGLLAIVTFFGFALVDAVFARAPPSNPALGRYAVAPSVTAVTPVPPFPRVQMGRMGG